MLEITGNDISELNDSDLRALIGLLCETELRSIGIPTSGVTWGGHQNAGDGGSDVRVELTTTLHNDSFIPRSKTVFQVKKPDMPRSSIINEMRQKGELRPVIKDLINSHGAYIIVSSQGSTADSALRNRKDAMEEAISDYPNAANIKVDFYDRERIAGWVRCHPAIVLWVRSKLGRPIQGWKPFGNWANCPGGVEEEYYIDGQLRIHNSANPRADGLSAIDGINTIRNILYHPASSIRLVGLSGVGKTRLVQALFDERIGERALNRSQVLYSDINDSPNPDPRNMAERLIALKKFSILVIDNCPPDVHRRLTSVCSAQGSLVSLITIEYDVREDLPEETEVFSLEPASTELIEKVISSRFSHVSKVDLHNISEFSGGNARIAIALANTVLEGENLSNLKDEELFLRLFHQRNEPDNSLLKAAEVCSLVYSFNCQTVQTDSELEHLGSLVEMSASKVYENTSELKRRNLVQQRGIWRAVLPHAVANKLAKRALENIPLDNIYIVFENKCSERLLKSFSRRLSYLHECEVAKEITKKWISKDGILGDVRRFNELKITLFKYIAPIIPELSLFSIERIATLDGNEDFFSRNNRFYNEFTRLLRSLAYDKDLFNRSIELLIRFSLVENPNENNNSIRKLLKSLYYLYLSGTHATPEQRLISIKNLIKSKEDKQITLGLNLLDASLESWHFSNHYGFEFGARARNYGYSPKNKEEIRHWFKLFIGYTTSLAVSNLTFASKAKALMAEKFRGLWIKAGMYDELEVAAMEISSQDGWCEGWVAIKTTKRFDGKNMDPKVLSRLDNLEKVLKPTTLIEKSRLYALSNHRSTLDLVDTSEGIKSDNFYEVEEITRSLGYDVSNNENVFQELLPEILHKDGARLFAFGKGLAEGTSDPNKMWQDFCEQLSSLEDSIRNYQVLRGFLNGIFKRDVCLTEKFLDEAVTNKVLAPVYPYLQTSVEITPQGVERLMKSIKFETAPISQYYCLAYGRVSEAICDDDICELLRLISSKENGLDVSIEILEMRLYNIEANNLSESIISLGQELILKYQFSRKDNTRDNGLASLIKKCFADESSTEIARALCKKILNAYTGYNIYSTDYNDVLEALAIMKPRVFLEVFLGDIQDDYFIASIFQEDIGVHVNPIHLIDENIIISWCEVDPERRYPKIASAIEPFQKGGKGNYLEWTPVAIKLINNSHDPIVILNKLKLTFRPRSWSGSRADIMQTRLCLIQELQKHEDSFIVDWACKEGKVFEEEIRSEREWESTRDSELNERFE